MLTVEIFEIEVGATGCFYMELSNWKKIYIKRAENWIYKCYEWDEKAVNKEDFKQIELSHDEWIVITSEMTTKIRKAIAWKTMSFIESIWWDEKIVEARKSVYWQLVNN